MPVWRIVSVIAALGVVVFCLWAFASGLSSGPGMGEVSVILHGGFMMLALVLAGFFSLVAALFLFWDKLWLRRALMVCTVGPLVLALASVGVSSVGSYIRNAEYRQERAEAEAKAEARRAAKQAAETDVRPIADRYISQLLAPDFQPDDFAQLEQSYAEEIKTSGIENPRMANSDFYLKVHFDLYRYNVARAADAPEPRYIGNGLLHEAACYEFSNAFKSRFTEQQADIFSVYCSDRAIAAGPAAMERVR